MDILVIAFSHFAMCFSEYLKMRLQPYERGNVLTDNSRTVNKNSKRIAQNRARSVFQLRLLGGFEGPYSLFEQAIVT